MTLDKLTQKSREAVQEAQTLAVRYGHQEVDVDHLGLALLNQDGGLLPRLCERAGIDPTPMREAIDAELKKKPSVSGPGAEPGKIMITQALQRLLVQAGDEASRLMDEYISVEHLALALLDTGDSSATGRLMAQFGLTRDRLLQALTAVRGNQRVTSDDPEASYEALEKYGIDLVGPEAFPVLKKYGLIPTMVPGGSGIKAGINDKKLHAAIDKKMREAIRAAAAAGAPNVIVMAGDRHGISDEEGLDNAVLFLNNIKSFAEDKGVTLCMELLNSKVNHKDYQCDHTDWGVRVCKAVGSLRAKLLYDIYHMAIMEGDIIQTIRDNIQYIGHFHTGRFRLDDVFGLLLRSDIQNRIAAFHYRADRFASLLKHRLSLMQINDIDAVFLHEDVLLHLRVPTAGKVSEMASCEDQLLDGDSGHHLSFGPYDSKQGSKPRTPLAGSGGLRWRSAIC